VRGGKSILERNSTRWRPIPGVVRSKLVLYRIRMTTNGNGSWAEIDGQYFGWISTRQQAIFGAVLVFGNLSHPNLCGHMEA